MKVGARNRIVGTVKEIQRGTLMAQVKVKAVNVLLMK
jgi:molybdopterin-binding protein